MGPLAVGQVALIRFPFSDLSSAKLRPVLILANSGRGDWLCMQITSNPYSDPSAIELGPDAFQTGTLSRVSYARPGKLFTAHASIFQKSVGVLTGQSLQASRDAAIRHIQSGGVAS